MNYEGKFDKNFNGEELQNANKRKITWMCSYTDRTYVVRSNEKIQ